MSSAQEGRPSQRGLCFLFCWHCRCGDKDAVDTAYSDGLVDAHQDEALSDVDDEDREACVTLLGWDERHNALEAVADLISVEDSLLSIGGDLGAEDADDCLVGNTSRDLTSGRLTRAENACSLGTVDLFWVEAARAPRLYSSRTRTTASTEAPAMGMSQRSSPAVETSTGTGRPTC